MYIYIYIYIDAQQNIPQQKLFHLGHFIKENSMHTHRIMLVAPYNKS